MQGIKQSFNSNNNKLAQEECKKREENRIEGQFYYADFKAIKEITSK